MANDAVRDCFWSKKTLVDAWVTHDQWLRTVILGWFGYWLLYRVVHPMTGSGWSVFTPSVWSEVVWITAGWCTSQLINYQWTINQPWTGCSLAISWNDESNPAPTCVLLMVNVCRCEAPWTVTVTHHQPMHTCDCDDFWSMSYMFMDACHHASFSGERDSVSYCTQNCPRRAISSVTEWAARP